MKIESLLSARLFMVPKRLGDKLYFVSNLSGRNSLYVMDASGSIPKPLLPPDIALANPHLVSGELYALYPELNKILIMLDQHGDEVYRPMFIPLEGGFPQPIFAEELADFSCVAFRADSEKNTIYLMGQSQSQPLMKHFFADLAQMTLTAVSEGMYGHMPVAVTEDKSQYILTDQFGVGDSVFYHRQNGEETLLYGVPVQERQAGQRVKPSGIRSARFIMDDSALLVDTILFEDTFGLAIMPIEDDPELTPVTIEGIQHTGMGEFEGFSHIDEDKYILQYNIDGCSWLYEATFDEDTHTMTLNYVLCGQGELTDGMLESWNYDKEGDRYALSFSTAVSTTQLYTISGAQRDQIERHTDEGLVGLDDSLLSKGEDASFTSHDGLRISARLYLPHDDLGFEAPYPVVYYIHGGPQSQERPDFAWFSMPLIQFLTLKGFAVFVPNVRGSTGYGFAYMNRVVRDWGGQDMLDHVHAMTEFLPKDERLNVERAGVMGRSYGGYMTLLLASRYPELWQASIDMFGPYNLVTFGKRVPETWKPFIAALVGDPETEADFLLERSPVTYLDNISAPMLVIQGKNDPRVVEVESAELVQQLQDKGKEVDYLMFPDEGHDMVKYDNRVRCYNAITDYFLKHL